MGEMLLNGRVPLAWELEAIECGRARQRALDAESVAGLLAEVSAEVSAVVPERAPRLVTDIAWEFQ